MIGTQQTDTYDEAANEREAYIRNYMAVQGVSREVAEAAFPPVPSPNDIVHQPSVFESNDFDSAVEDPSSSVIEETSTTKLENGTTITQSIKNPNNGPKGIAEKQSTEESNSTASQDSSLDEKLLNEYGLGSFGVDQDIGMLDSEGWGAYDDINRWDSAAPTGTMENALQDHQGTLGLWDGTLSDPLSETEELINSITGAGITPDAEYAEPKVSATQDADDAIDVLAKDGTYELGVVNNFAQWADQQTDDAAVEKATEIMKKAKESGIDRVKPHVYKALGIAMASMLFGADAATAANQGLGAVAAGFERTRQQEAALAQVQAEREDYMFKESYETDQNIRQEAAKLAINAPAKAREADKALTASNYAAIKDMGAHIQGMSSELKEELGLTAATGEIQRAVSELFKTYGKMDLKDPEVGGNFHQGIKDWLMARKEGNRSEPLESFIKAKIARVELTGYEGRLDEADLTREDGHAAGERQQREDIAALFGKVRSAAAIGKGGESIGETTAIKLIMKDFEDYKYIHKTKADADADEAAAKGMTPFVYFVLNSYVVDSKRLGSMYKEETGASLTQYLNP
jgi:hypothetical protein